MIPTPSNSTRHRSDVVSTGKSDILGISFDALDFSQALDHLIRLAQGNRPAYSVTANVNHIVRYHRCPELHHLYTDADMVLADGMPVIWASRLLGKPLPERVPGSDLMPALCARAADCGLSVFLLGGAPGTARHAADALRTRYDRLRVAGTYCPHFGFEDNPSECVRIIDLIRTAGPDIVFVGLGSPKQENWIVANRQACEAKLSIGVGVTFSFVSGHIPRAPRWMHRLGLEWCHRLVHEPGRLWKRYLNDAPAFVALVLRELYRSRKLLGQSSLPTMTEKQHVEPSGVASGPARVIANPSGVLEQARRAECSMRENRTGTFRDVARDRIKNIIASYDSLVIRAYCRIRFLIMRIRFLEELDQYIPREGRIVDLGCGFGLFSLYFASSGPQRTISGIDLSAKRIKAAQHSARKLGLSNADYIQGDALSHPLPGSLACVYTLDILHHLPEDAVRPLLSRLWDALADDAVLLVKDVDTQPAYKLWFTLVLDRLMVGTEAIKYWPVDTMIRMLEDVGFRVHTHEMRDVLPYPHRLYICHKRK